MAIKEYVMIISAIIVVIGWFINSYLNRKHEISKKRLEYRLETLKSFLPVYKSITSSKQPFKDDKKLNEKIIDARINFQLYGNEDEINLFHKFTDAVEKNDITNATININKLIKLIRKRIRDELDLAHFDLN